MIIERTVTALQEKYGTLNPFKLAEYLNIKVFIEPLGSVSGYYNDMYGRKIIHINEDLNEDDQMYTCAHELAHAIFHPSLNVAFLKDTTYFSVDKLEQQANDFAVRLMISNEEIEEYLYDVLQGYAETRGIDTDIIQRRVSAYIVTHCDEFTENKKELKELADTIQLQGLSM